MRVAFRLIPVEIEVEVEIEVDFLPFLRVFVFHCPPLSLISTTLSANDRGGANRGERGGGGRGGRQKSAEESKEGGGAKSGERGGGGGGGGGTTETGADEQGKYP